MLNFNWRKLAKAPLTGHRMILDGMVFELKGIMDSSKDAKAKYYYVLEFIEDAPAQEQLETNSHSEDFLEEPS